MLDCKFHLNGLCLLGRTAPTCADHCLRQPAPDIGIERLKLWQVIYAEHLDAWRFIDVLQKRGNGPVHRANPLSAIDMTVILDRIHRRGLVQNTGVIVQALWRKLMDIAHPVACIVAKCRAETAVKLGHCRAQTRVRHMCGAKKTLGGHTA